MRQWAAAQPEAREEGSRISTRIPTLNGQPSPQGATHDGNLIRLEQPQGQPTQTWNDIDTKLADTMSSHWVNFITKGDPERRRPAAVAAA